MRRLIGLIVIGSIISLLTSCSFNYLSTTDNNSETQSNYTTVFVTTVANEKIDESQAIEIAIQKFNDYLSEHPKMKVSDPIYTATQKNYHDISGYYWAVNVKLREEQYSMYHYEVWISSDGQEVTLATG